MAGLLDLLSGGGGQLTPQQMGLLGMAAQMSNAFAPQPASRLPLAKPNGAYLIGQAAGGYGRGYAAGLETQRANLQNQMLGAQIGFYRDALPGLLAQISGQPQGQSVAPAGSSQGAPSGAPPTVPLAFKSGGSPIGGPGVSSDAPLDLPGASAAPAAPASVGPANPSADFGTGLPPSVAAAQRLAEIGAMLHMNGMGTAASMGLQYNPALQAQIARAKLQGSDPVAYNLALAQRYQGTPLGNLYYNAALQKAGALSISSWSGNRNEYNPVTGQWSFFGPQNGVMSTGTSIQPIPGWQATMQGNKAAEARGEAGGEVVRVQNPDGSYSWVPRSAYLGGNTGAPTLPGGLPGMGAPAAAGALPGLSPPIVPRPGQPSTIPGAPLAAPVLPGARSALPPAQLSPLANTYQTSRGEQLGTYQTNLDKAADDATTANYSLDQLTKDTEGFTPGPGVDIPVELAKAFSTVGRLWGQTPPKTLTSYQEFSKYANQLAFAASRQLGTREAAQIVQMQIDSNPNASLTPDAIKGLVGAMHGFNDYVIDKNAALNSWVKQNGTPQGFDSTWNKSIDPRAWGLNSLDRAAQIKLYQSLSKPQLQRLMNSYRYYQQAGAS
jgi:hypothetical protein